MRTVFVPNISLDITKKSRRPSTVPCGPLYKLNPGAEGFPFITKLWVLNLTF